MWIMTDVGFISIVKHNKLPDTMVVRARVKADLKALFPGHAVETLPGADYLYRSTIPTQVVAEVLFYKVIGLDYTSHSKDVAIARSAKAEHGTRSHAMYDTWSAFADLQELAPYSKTPRPVARKYVTPSTWGKPPPVSASANPRNPLGRSAATSAATFSAAKPWYAGGTLPEATIEPPYDAAVDGVPDYTGQKDWVNNWSDTAARNWSDDQKVQVPLDQLSERELEELSDAEFNRMMDDRDEARRTFSALTAPLPTTPVETKREIRNRKARERRAAKLVADMDAATLRVKTSAS